MEVTMYVVTRGFRDDDVPTLREVVVVEQPKRYKVVKGTEHVRYSTYVDKFSLHQTPAAAWHSYSDYASESYRESKVLIAVLLRDLRIASEALTALGEAAHDVQS